MMDETRGYKKMPEDRFLYEIAMLDSILKDFCSCNGTVLKYSDIISNMQIVKDVVTRVDKRRHYYKIFHDDMVISEHKETALYCYWIIKLKPFWIAPGNSFSHCINEMFCVHMVLCLLKRFNADFDRKDGLYKKYSEELLYSFRFRELSKEALILMLEPFYYDYLRGIPVF